VHGGVVRQLKKFQSSAKYHAAAQLCSPTVHTQAPNRKNECVFDVMGRMAPLGKIFGELASIAANPACFRRIVDAMNEHAASIARPDRIVIVRYSAKSSPAPAFDFTSIRHSRHA
jgi:hypothetical protein